MLNCIGFLSMIIFVARPFGHTSLFKVNIKRKKKTEGKEENESNNRLDFKLR